MLPKSFSTSVSSVFSTKIVEFPIMEILKVFSSPIDTKKYNSEFKAFYSSFQLPLVEKTYLSGVYDAMLFKKDIESSLSSVIVFFPFNMKHIKSFSEIYEKDGNTMTLVPFIYYFVVSWLGQKDEAIYDSFEILMRIIINMKAYMPVEIYEFIKNAMCQKFVLKTPRHIGYPFICEIFEVCTALNFELCSVLLKRSIEIRDGESTEYVLRLLSRAIDKNPSLYSSFNMKNIAGMIEPYVLSLHTPSLSLLTSITKCSFQDPVMDLIKCLICSVFCQLPEDNPVKIEYNSRIPEISNGIDMMCSISFEFDSHNSFPQGLIPLQIQDEDQISPISSLLSEMHKYPVAAICPLLDEMSCEYKDRTIEEITQIIEHQGLRYDLYIDFLTLLTHYSSNRISESIMNVILHKDFFNDFFCICFSYQLDNPIHIIRNAVIRFFVFNCPFSLPSMLRRIINHPFLFSEAIARIRVFLNQIPKTLFTSDDMLGAIIHVLAVLSQLYKVGKDEIGEYILIAHSTLFLFLFSLLEDPSIASILFSSSVFASGFLSRVLESSLQDSILSSFTKFLQEYNPTNSFDIRPSVELIGALLKVSSTKSNDKHLNRLSIGLITCVNSASLMNLSLPYVFLPIIDNVLDYLLSSLSFDFLSQAMVFFSDISITNHQFVFSLPQIGKISQAIKMIEKEDPSETTLNRILGMIANSRSVSLSTMLVIQKPVFIVLLVSLFGSRGKLLSFLEFLKSLCQYSIANSIMCSLGEIDLLLLEYLSCTTAKFSFRHCEFDYLLKKDDFLNAVIPLLIEISSHKSSPQVVSKYINLVIPKHGFGLSKYADISMQSISSIISSQSRFNKFSVPIGFEFPLIVNNDITLSDISRGFSLICFIRIDQAYSQIVGTHPLIFSLTDRKITMRLIISGTSLICKVFSNRGISSVLLTSSLPSCEWTSFLLTFSFNNDGQAVYSFNTHSSQASVYPLLCPCFSDSPLTLEIGSVFESSHEKISSHVFSTMLGGFYLYNSVIPADKFNSSSSSMHFCEINNDYIFSIPDSGKPKLLFR